MAVPGGEPREDEHERPPGGEGHLLPGPDAPAAGVVQAQERVAVDEVAHRAVAVLPIEEGETEGVGHVFGVPGHLGADLEAEVPDGDLRLEERAGGAGEEDDEGAEDGARAGSQGIHRARG